MGDKSLLPFTNQADWMLRHCRLPLHSGTGQVGQHGQSDSQWQRMFRQIDESLGKPPPESVTADCHAEFFVPVDTGCRIFLRWKDKGRLNRNFGEELIVVGEGVDGPFRLFCPHYYVKSCSDANAEPGWAVAAPINGPATISYGEDRPVASVAAVINNFDFEQGNVRGDESAGDLETLRVDTAGRTVDFAWTAERRQLRQLVDAGFIGSTSFVTFSFKAWANASDQDLSDFAEDVASLCSYVVAQHTGIPILSFFDADGRVVRRMLGSRISSKFRDDCILPALHLADGLPQVFRECFNQHCQMRRSPLWRQMPAFVASIEDPPYLEQKYASLMAAIELLIRSSLLESSVLISDDAQALTLPDLIGIARGRLRWDVPKHYLEADRYRKTRNAVGHGAALPHAPDQVRADFDKWKLFLSRRLFIRLGYSGHVVSPQEGWVSSSPVHEFSKEHNAFRN